MSSRRRFPALLAFLGAMAPMALWGQAASSESYFLSAGAIASGAEAQSAGYRLRPAVGAAPGAGAASSALFILAAGFPAAIGVPASGRPWLAGVTPSLTTMNGAAPLVIHGRDLDLGPVPLLTIGGQTATVLTRTSSRLTTVVPAQPAPGKQAAAASNALGTTVLPDGLTVLPMIGFEPAFAPFEPSTLVYRGTTGDLVIIVISAGLSPVPIVAPPFGHAIRVDIPGIALWIPPTMQLLPVLDPGGAFRITFPPIPFVPTGIAIQGLAVSGHPGYAPGAFTNVVVL